MRVTTYEGLASTGIRRDPGRTEGGPAFTSLLGPGSPQGSAGARGSPAAMVPLHSLLLLQAVPNAVRRPHQRASRGRRLLDGLDDLRLALLQGEVPVALLQHLRDGLKATDGRGDEPQLDDILEQIELRVMVELAKLEHAQRHGAAFLEGGTVSST